MDSIANIPSFDITFVIKNTSSINRSIKVFNTRILPGGTLDLMKVPGVTEEDIRAELTKGSLRNLLSNGDLTVVTSTVNLNTNDQNHALFLNSLSLTSNNGNSLGLEVLFSGGTLTLNPSVYSSILVNDTGGSVTFTLPDGIDGQVKEIVNGANNNAVSGRISNAFIYLACHNNLNNDGIDLNLNTSIKLVWCTAASGWVSLGYNNTVNSGWD